MSRRLIIGLLIVLIVGTVGGTAFLIVQRLQSNNSQTPSVAQSPGSLQEADRGSQQIVDPTGDDDGDGLSNADEATWGTNPKNPDTDGDGFTDGNEVAAGHNPGIPAPNDALPEGFVPGRDLQPLDAAPSEPIAVDQFFASNLDLTGGKKNYTEDYNRTYKEDERGEETLLIYAKSQPIITQLPVPAAKAIQLQASDTPFLLSSYLETAGNVGIFSNRQLFATAINDLFENRNPSTIKGLAIMVRIYQEDLINAKVPPTAESLQKLQLGYTELLAATFDQMAEYNQDAVKAVVAMHQWSEIDKRYIPLIEREVDRLQALNATLASN